MHEKSVVENAIMIALIVASAIITATGRPALSLLILSSMYIYQHRGE